MTKFNRGDKVQRINYDNHWYQDGEEILLKVGTIVTIAKDNGHVLSLIEYPGVHHMSKYFKLIIKHNNYKNVLPLP